MISMSEPIHCQASGQRAVKQRCEAGLESITACGRSVIESKQTLHVATGLTDARNSDCRKIKRPHGPPRTHPTLSDAACRIRMTLMYLANLANVLKWDSMNVTPMPACFPSFCPAPFPNPFASPARSNRICPLPFAKSFAAPTPLVRNCVLVALFRASPKLLDSSEVTAAASGILRRLYPGNLRRTCNAAPGRHRIHAAGVGNYLVLGGSN